MVSSLKEEEGEKFMVATAVEAEVEAAVVWGNERIMLKLGQKKGGRKEGVNGFGGINLMPTGEHILRILPNFFPRVLY